METTTTTTTTTTTNKDECIELKNIMYKTMLLSGNVIKETKSVNDLSNIEKFLEEEKNMNKSEPWSKLDKTVKMKKLLEYAEMYKSEKHLNEEENQNLVSFLKDCLNRKKLYRVKDVSYDKTSGLIKEIPALVYNKPNKHFTLKNMDKRVSTLKSLPPKKDLNKRPTTKEIKPATEEPILESV